MKKERPSLDEVVQWYEQVKPLIQAIFKKQEIRKGDRNKWRGKARRLLRKISDSI